MSQNKMSPAPWKIAATPSQTGGSLSDANGNKFLRVYSYSNTKEEDASAIVSAVNNTYGSGVNPEAVPDLLKALKAMVMTEDLRSNNNKNYIFTPSYHSAKAAIDKAKLI